MIDTSDLELFIFDEKHKQRIGQAARLADIFATRAERHDRENSFPFENFAELKEAGFLSLSVPREFGGEACSLSEFVLVQETLARGDASTALGLGWHVGIVMNLRETRSWPDAVFRKVCEDIVRNGTLINALSTEASTGSPSRGRRHETTAVKTDRGWCLNGRKTWSTLSPALHYIMISAAIEGTDQLGEFLLTRDTPGVTMEETWNSIGMRATGSHDMILDHVKLPPEALLDQHAYGQASAKSADGGGWMLHISACYIGLAAAARDFAVRFASEYYPGGSEHPISHFPNVQDRIGRMEIDLFAARSAMYTMARRWDEYPRERRHELKEAFAAVKFTATNASVRIVDEAMRIVGGRSMLKQYPLERYYRDVRGGLHNPPMDDATIKMMASRVIDRMSEA